MELNYFALVKTVWYRTVDKFISAVQFAILICGSMEMTHFWSQRPVAIWGTAVFGTLMLPLFFSSSTSIHCATIYEATTSNKLAYLSIKSENRGKQLGSAQR